MSKLNAFLTYKDEKENEYKFELYSLDHEFSESWGGIYIFTKRDTSENPPSHRLLYIGKAKSFDSRFDNHEKIKESKEHGINCVGVYKENDSPKRNSIETSLIESNKPKLNIQNNS